MKLPKHWLLLVVAAGVTSVYFLFGAELLTPDADGQGDSVADKSNIVAELGVRHVNTTHNNLKKPKSKPKPITTPFSHEHDFHDSDFVESDEGAGIFDDSAAGIYLRNHFNLLENTEPDSEQRQDESLKKMRETPEIFVEKLAEAYEHLERDQFLDRYKVVYMMENLHTPSAIPFLANLAQDKIPEEVAPYEGDGHINEPHNEGLIRMRAVGGLYALATEGDNDARDSLLETVLTTNDRTVKNDAIWAFLATSKEPDNDKEYLQSILPKEDQKFLTVKISNIEDAQKQVESAEEDEGLIEDAQEQIDLADISDH